MEATLLLADYAVVQDGKLNLMGAGWTYAGPNTPWAIAFIIHVPWSEANRQHAWRLELLDADGNDVLDDNGQKIQIGGHFEVGRPPGIHEGTTLEMMQAINSGPLPLPPDRRWQWRLLVNDEPVATCEFATRPASP